MIDLDKVQEYKGTKLSEIFDYYDLIPLETGDDFLISNIQRMKKRNGRYYVQHNEHQLDVFDGEGRHLTKIGIRGQGPGEYPYLCDFDADDKHVYVLTVGKLICYDLTGVLQKETPIDAFQWAKIRRIKGGFLIQSTQATTDGNHFALLDDDGNLVKTAVPFKYAEMGGGNIAWPEWREGCYIYQMNYSDDFYCFDNRTKEFSTLPYASQKVGASIEECEEADRQRKLPDGYVSGFSGSATHLLWSRVKNKEYFCYTLDKKTRKVCFYSYGKVKDDLAFPIIQYPHSVVSSIWVSDVCDSDDEYMFSFIDDFSRFDLEEACRQSNPKFPQAYKRIENLSDDANPVIVSFRFKAID